MSLPEVFRDEIKKGRDGYFVTYWPADARRPVAQIQLTFINDNVDVIMVARTMKKELEHWLKRYPVGVVVTAFNSKGDCLCVHPEKNQHSLAGFVDPQNNNIVQRRGVYEVKELPANQTDAQYLQKVYQDVPFRLKAEVINEARCWNRSVVRISRVIGFVLIAGPILIKVVSLFVAWIGSVLSAVSMISGVWMIAKSYGWLGQTDKEKQEEEKKRKMEHYYYHCELNPEAFNRLVKENDERETIISNRKEAQALGVISEVKAESGQIRDSE